MKAPQYGLRPPRAPRQERRCLVCGEPVDPDHAANPDAQTMRDPRFCSRACRMRYRDGKPA